MGVAGLGKGLRGRCEGGKPELTKVVLKQNLVLHKGFSSTRNTLRAFRSVRDQPADSPPVLGQGDPRDQDAWASLSDQSIGANNGAPHPDGHSRRKELVQSPAQEQGQDSLCGVVKYG